MSKNIGKVVQVIGTVVDVEFPQENLPEIYNALELEVNGEKLVLEVEQHVDSGLGARVAQVRGHVDEQEADLSKFCKTLSDNEHPGRSCATQRFRCNQVFRGTATGQCAGRVARLAALV